MNNVIYAYKRSAMLRGLEFGLTVEFMVQLFAANCYYCGCQPINVAGRSNKSNGVFIYSGIDRTDNSKGYTEDNVVPACKHCNRAKGVQDGDEFIARCKRVAAMFAC